MKQNTKWSLLLLLIFLIWGSFYPVSKSIVAEIHPLLTAFLRYFFALIPMLPFFLIESGKRRRDESSVPMSLREGIEIAGLGLLGVTGFAVFLFYGIKLSNSMLSSLLANTQPIFAAVLAPLIIGEAFPRKQLPGIFLGFLGMTLVVGSGGMGEVGLEGSKLLGNLFSTLASLAISLYYILLKSRVQKYGSLLPTFISFSAGSVFLLLLALAAGADFTVLTRTTPMDWLLIAYNGIFATAFVYLVHNRAVSELGVIRTVRMKFLIPVFGTILSVLFLKESAGPLTWTGMGIVLGATVYIQKSSRFQKN